MNLTGEVNLGGLSGDDAERGGMVSAPGWYRCTLSDVKEEDTGNLCFDYAVTRGVWEGSTVKDWLNDPDNARDEKGREYSMRRVSLYLKRLGLWDGESAESVNVDWTDAVGKEVVLHLVPDQGQKDENGKRQATGRLKVDFAGVFPPDHEKIPEEVRKALGLPHARKKAGQDEGASGGAEEAAPPPPRAPAEGGRKPAGAGNGKKPLDYSKVEI